MQALGIKSEMYGSLLIPVMTEKIPDEFCLIISRMMKSNAWDINELMEAFNELEAAKKSRFLGVASNDVEKPWLRYSKFQEPVTAAALHLTERKKLNNLTAFAHPGQKSHNCTSISDPERGKEF